MLNETYEAGISFGISAFYEILQTMQVGCDPLTIIVVILAAGDLGGFTLILIAVPLYAVLKTLVSNIFKYRQRIIDKANSNVKD